MDELFGLLYARPSFVEGVARILDFGNTLTDYNCALSPDEADYLALESDWRAVGDDLRAAMVAVEEEISSLSHVEEEPAARRAGEPAPTAAG